MNISDLLHSLAADTLFQTALVLIVLDLVLGNVASIVNPEKAGAWSAAYFGNFLRNDVLGKVLPWAGLYLVAKAAPNVDIVGVSIMDAANAAWIGVGVALGGSILNSLADLNIVLPTRVGAALQRKPSQPPAA